MSKWNELHQRVSIVGQAIRRGFFPTKEEQQGILRKRAEFLAKEPVQETATDGMEVTVFTLANETYGIETKFVIEVIAFDQLTMVPGAPGFIAGIVNLRGTILTLIDIKRFFGLPENGIDDLHKIVLIRAKETQAGLLADNLIGISHVAVNDLQTSLPTLTGRRADYLKGVRADGLIVLDVEKLLADERLYVNQKPEEHMTEANL